MLLYNLPAFSKGDTDAFLSSLARSNGMVKKGGALDLTGAARIVLRDWSVGNFPRFTPTPATSEASSLTASSLTKLYKWDEEALSMLRTKKEMRKSRGLVKLIAGDIECRKVDVETAWAGLEPEGDDRDQDQDTGIEDDEGEDVGMNNEEFEEDDDGDDEPAPLPTGKRKRLDKSTAPPPRPTKKVSFAADPKGSKRARTVGSAKNTTQVIAKAKLVSSKLKSPKIVNVSAGKVSHKSMALSTGGEEAYDFGKFF